VKTNPPGLTGGYFCSCYVPRETLRAQAIVSKTFFIDGAGFQPLLPAAATAGLHDAKPSRFDRFSHEIAKKHAVVINF
jgi:hypothetical protein